MIDSEKVMASVVSIGYHLDLVPMYLPSIVAGMQDTDASIPFDTNELRRWVDYVKRVEKAEEDTLGEYALASVSAEIEKIESMLTAQAEEDIVITDPEMLIEIYSMVLSGAWMPIRFGLNYRELSGEIRDFDIIKEIRDKKSAESDEKGYSDLTLFKTQSFIKGLIKKYNPVDMDEVKSLFVVKA